MAQELKTVDHVDLELYTGTWYEQASIPMIFQNSACVGTTAHYTLNPDQSIKVWNQCYIPHQQGYTLDRIEGRAFVADTSSNAKLKVSFGGPFAGDYWIIALDTAYSYALVGHPSRNYLWLLTREPVVAEEQIQMMLKLAQDQGYDLKRVKRTLGIRQKRSFK